MSVILYASPTGGLGKTTNALNTAIFFGKQCTYIDADASRVGSRWFEQREANGVAVDTDPNVITTRNIKTITQQVAQSDTEHYVIDTAGTLIDANDKHKYFELADLIITPIQSGIAFAEVLSFIDKMSDDYKIKALEISFFSRTNVSKFANVSINESNIPRLNTVVEFSTLHREAGLYGQAIHEYAPSSKHSKTAKKLHKEIISELS